MVVVGLLLSLLVEPPVTGTAVAVEPDPCVFRDPPPTLQGPPDLPAPGTPLEHPRDMDPMGGYYPASNVPSQLTPRVSISALPEAAPHDMVVAALRGVDGMRRISLGRTQLRSLEAVAHVRSLETLELYDTQVTDLGPLRHVTTLRFVDVEGTRVRDLAPLAHLPRLERLDLGATEVRDLGALRRAQCLVRLDARYSAVASVAPVGALPRLRTLKLDGSKVTDLGPLRRAKALEELRVADTGVRSVRPLAGLQSLRVLDISGTRVRDLRPLHRLVHLEELDIRDTPVSMDAVDALEEALPFTTIYTSVYDEEIERLQLRARQQERAQAHWLAVRAAQRAGEPATVQCDTATAAIDFYAANLDHGLHHAKQRMRDLKRWRAAACRRAREMAGPGA